MAKSKRREIIRERHRQEIMESALYLFGKKGYKDTTMEEIAEHAQFSKGAIYFYFPNKKYLFDEILNMLFNKIESIAEGAKDVEGEAREKLKTYALNLLKFFLSENRHSFHVMMQAIMQMEESEKELTKNYVKDRLRQISRILAEIIKTDMKRGKLKNIDPNLVIMAFNGMLRDIIYGCLNEEQINMKPEQMVELVIEIIFNGISKNKQDSKS